MGMGGSPVDEKPSPGERCMVLVPSLSKKYG